MLISKKKQNGFSMIEVLVSLVVIGTGVLGLSGLQLATLKGTNNAHSRNIAVMLAMELSDRMRANPAGVAGGFYGVDVNCGEVQVQCRGTTDCTPQQVATTDVQEVMCGLEVVDGALGQGGGDEREGGAERLLPNGTLDVSCNNAPCGTILAQHTITLTWNNAKLADNQSDDDLTRTITVQVVP